VSERERLLEEALLATEWHREDGHGSPQCSVCGGWGDLDEGPEAGHREDCIVGKALGRRIDPNTVERARLDHQAFVDSFPGPGATP
jgi:hypothetical protein